MLTEQNENNNKQLTKTKDEVFLSEKKLKQQTQELNDYKTKNSQLELNNNQLETKIKEFQEKSKNIENLENLAVDLEKKKNRIT